MINNCNCMLRWALINFQNWSQTIASKEPPPPRGSRHHIHTMSIPVCLAALLDLLFILPAFDAHGYLKTLVSQFCFLLRWKNTDTVYKLGQHKSFHGDLFHHRGLYERTFIIMQSCLNKLGGMQDRVIVGHEGISWYTAGQIWGVSPLAFKLWMGWPITMSFVNR